MGVRDFTDESGVAWRVWAVNPDTLQPHTRAEDYLGAYLGGWLCFESAEERRRLADFPADWERLEAGALCALLQRAAPVRRRRSSHLDPPDSRAP